MMTNNLNDNYEDGRIILIDKPLDWTSFDVVKKIRNAIRIKKVGHAGTLDPLATGLLIVCTGKFTRQINGLMLQEKEYIGTLTLGATTPTYDLESETGNFKSINNISDELLDKVRQQFTGNILQTPPIHSAIKQNGKPVYLIARKGVDVKLDPRPVTIHEFIFTEVNLPVITFKVVCSTGTYIRSLANDFGKTIGCGGYLSSLRRTKIGEYNVNDAVTPKQFVEGHLAGKL